MCPGGYPIQESQNWQAGFLPGVYQGTYIDTQAHRRREADREHPQRPHRAGRSSASSSTCCSSSTQPHQAERPQRRRSSKPASSRSSWPTACRRRRPTPSTSRREPQHIRDMYGPGTQARQLLIARRLVERGVRFVQVWHGAGQPWDNHDDIEVNHRKLAEAVRPGDRRPADRPEAARPARRHAGHLGRRVRPHADGRAADAGRERRQDQRPRPQPLRLHDVAGRRRRQGRPGATARPTSSASRPSRTRSTSTTCTPRSCTCWASTTRSSPTATPAATSA